MTDEAINELEQSIDSPSLESLCRQTALMTQQVLTKAGELLAACQGPMETAEAELRRQIAELQEKFEAENKKVFVDYEEAMTAWRKADLAHRSAIIKLYESQSDSSIKSNLIPGWGVSVSTKMEYVGKANDQTAIEYLIQHNHPEALKLNMAKFTEMAKILKPDFVEFKPVVTAKAAAKPKGER